MIQQLVGSPIENLLHNSRRFQVSDRPGPFRVIAKITDLRISQVSDKKSTALGGFLKKAVAKTVKVNGEAFEADWSKDELQMNIQCSVTVQVRDSSGILLAGQTGSVLRQDTTKNIKAELAGLKYTSGATQTHIPATSDSGSQMFQFQSRLIELATFEALLLLMPESDSKLALGITKAAEKSDNIGASDNASVEEPNANPGKASPEPGSPITKAAFCSECGSKVGAAAKFCQGCGSKILRE